MELFQLRYFVAAGRKLNFSRAAESLYVSQPSLSQQVARLESDLGTLLFHRTGRRVTLTQAGQALLPLAERLLAGEAEARRTVEEVAGLRRGRLTLYSLPALEQHLLPPWLARFRREHPDIQLQVRELRPARAIAQAVAEGEADLGFVHLPYEVDGLEHRVLLEDPFVVVVPEAHPLALKHSLGLGDVADEEWVWVREANDPDHPLYAACTAAGFRPRIVCESGSAQGVMALVAAGLGIALLPNLAIEARSGLKRVPLVPAPVRTLAVIWSPEKLEPAASAFLQLCEAPLIGS